MTDYGVKHKNDRCFNLEDLINDFARELIDENNAYHKYSLDVVISQDPERFGIEVLKNEKPKQLEFDFEKGGEHEKQ